MFFYSKFYMLHSVMITYPDCRDDVYIVSLKMIVYIIVIELVEMETMCTSSVHSTG